MKKRRTISVPVGDILGPGKPRKTGERRVECAGLRGGLAVTRQVCGDAWAITHLRSGLALIGGGIDRPGITRAFGLRVLPRLAALTDWRRPVSRLSRQATLRARVQAVLGTRHPLPPPEGQGRG